MNLGKTLTVKSPEQWRKWLLKNHDKEKEIWVVFYKKDSGKWTISYEQALDEALCFGWIDSIVKKVDKEARAQRFTPRRVKSPISELNKEKVRRLIKEGKMTKAGLIKIQKYLDEEFVVPKDLLKEIKKDKETFKNFNNFPENYRKIRIAFIEGARKRPEEFNRRLTNFLKMTKQNKTFGRVG